MQQDPINFPQKSSVPIPGGGDSHIHPYGPTENDFTVTTRLPGGFVDHTDVNIKGPGPQPPFKLPM